MLLPSETFSVIFSFEMLVWGNAGLSFLHEMFIIAVCVRRRVRQQTPAAPDFSRVKCMQQILNSLASHLESCVALQEVICAIA
jgi:hypothetical protein